jgi:DNA-binding LacI/PurR family transcriptional regulator
MGPADRITLRDVAREAGVSPTTVSFVLNDTPRQTIPDATRERVHEAAARLGYTPHRIARALREGSSRIVLLTTGPWRGGASLDQFIAGLGGELRANDHTLLVHYGGQDEPAFHDVIDTVSPRAILDMTGVDQDREGADWTDGLSPASTLQLQHLARHGHRAVAVALPRAEGLGHMPATRLAQAQRAAVALGLDPIVTLTVGDPADDVSVVAQLRREHPSVTAIAGFDDEVALRILGALRELGVPVPDEIAVIGFDDSRAGALWSPPLTSIHIDAATYGRRAACAALGLEPPLGEAAPTVVERATV